MKSKVLIIILALFFGFLIVGCNQKTYDLSNVKFEDKTVIYDGNSHSILIQGELPTGVSVTYENNDQTEVGSYEVVAKFIGEKGYKKIPNMTATLVINQVDAVALPDLTDQREADITSNLNNVGITNFTFKEIFNVKNFSGTFVGYENYQVGQVVSSTDEIVVLIATRKLPDITKIYTEEIENFFLNAGVRSENIIGVPQTEGDPEFGLGYVEPQAAGMDYQTGQIKYYYNSVDVKLRDLSGYSIQQIDAYLAKMDLTGQKFDLLDNSKEMDTFGKYLTHQIGQIVKRGTTIPMYIIKNDDYHQEKQLFFSKYVDVSIGNNGVELYNPTDSELNLADYFISIFENGSYNETYRVELAGQLPSKETFFIASETSSEDLKTKANLVSPLLIFDGNDTIQLRKTYNKTFIDTIYNVGNTIFTLDDEIFIRRQTITTGRRDYVSKEWAGYIPSFTEVIGNHPYEIPAFPPFQLLEPTFQEFGMTLVKYLSAADGDTVYFESLDPRDTTSYSGTSRLRFLMVDTPETEKPGVVGEPYAQEASRFTKNALSTASEIYIQSDPSAGLKENYGRHLGVVWYNSGTKENPSWHLLNYELSYYGLGDPAGFKDLTGTYKNSIVWGNRYLYQWVQDADINAKDNKLGIHSGVIKP